jgi:hypothetical protein
VRLNNTACLVNRGYDHHSDSHSRSHSSVTGIAITVGLPVMIELSGWRYHEGCNKRGGGRGGGGARELAENLK